MLRLSSGLRDAILGGSSSDSVQHLLEGCVLRIFSGTQPTSSDLTEATSTLLAEISLNGAGFSPGTPSTNGLSFDDPANGAIPKASAETWQGDGIADGNAGWFRLYASVRTVGASTTAVRLDGTIASSGGELTMSNNLIAVGTPVIINTFDIALPTS